MGACQGSGPLSEPREGGVGTRLSGVGARSLLRPERPAWTGNVSPRQLSVSRAVLTQPLVGLGVSGSSPHFRILRFGVT